MVRIGRGLSRFSARGLSQFSRSENGTVPFGTAETRELSQFSRDHALHGARNGTVPFGTAETRGLSQFSLGENGTVPFTLDYEELLRG
jgi:hypothetical protein